MIGKGVNHPDKGKGVVVACRPYPHPYEFDVVWQDGSESTVGLGTIVGTSPTVGPAIGVGPKTERKEEW